MEIVLIRHGQPEWMVDDEYQSNPKLTKLGVKQANASSTLFEKHSIEELWVSPLQRAQETHEPFKEKEVPKAIHTFDWLKEMEDDEEKALYGKNNREVMEFFANRNMQSFEDWNQNYHGTYMKSYTANIISHLEEELAKRGVVSVDDTYDRLFKIEDDAIKSLMIISHAGTMSALISYFLNVPIYAWTWRKFLPRHTGHTRLKSNEISGGHFFRLKEFNNVSFLENREDKTY